MLSARALFSVGDALGAAGDALGEKDKLGEPLVGSRRTGVCAREAIPGDCAVGVFVCESLAVNRKEDGDGLLSKEKSGW